MDRHDISVHRADRHCLSPALRIVGKYEPTLGGCAVGILVTDGADGKILMAVKAAAEEAGATVKTQRRLTETAALP